MAYLLKRKANMNEEDLMIEGFTFDLGEALQAEDFIRVLEIINKYYFQLYHEAETNSYRMRKGQGKYLDSFRNLFKILLTMSDRLFVSPPSQKVDDWFQAEMRECQEALNKANEMMAMETSEHLKSLVDERQNRLKTLEEKGYYDRDEFVSFWRLWKLLDDILNHEDFPPEDYDSFAANLYGAIMPSLLIKEGIVCLARYYEEIF